MFGRSRDVEVTGSGRIEVTVTLNVDRIRHYADGNSLVELSLPSGEMVRMEAGETLKLILPVDLE